MYQREITLTEAVNGIPAGSHGHITQVRPGFLGSPWVYAFMADDWEVTRHPFTLVTDDQFTLDNSQVDLGELLTEMTAAQAFDPAAGWVPPKITPLPADCRAAACLSACAGVPGGLLHEGAYREMIVAQTELTALLQEAVDESGAFDRGERASGEWVARAKALLAGGAE